MAMTVTMQMPIEMAPTAMEIDPVTIPIRIPNWSLLLSLPAELRNDVYQSLLSATEPIDISKPVRQPGLTQVSRQIQRESLTWYYTRNIFSVCVCNGNLSDLVDFACRTPREALWMIRDWGRLRVSTKYTSIYDMPVSQSALEWRQVSLALETKHSIPDGWKSGSSTAVDQQADRSG